MPPQTFQSRLIGSWDILHYRATSLTNPCDIIYPLGPQCRGRGIFSPDGYVSAHIQASDIMPYQQGREFRATKEELATAAKKTLTYTGRYRLEEHPDDSNKATIYYDVDVSLPPNWIGTTEVRELEFEEDGEGNVFLYLRPPGTMAIGGVERRVEVKAVRAGSGEKKNDARLS